MPRRLRVEQRLCLTFHITTHKNGKCVNLKTCCSTRNGRGIWSIKTIPSQNLVQILHPQINSKGNYPICFPSKFPKFSTIQITFTVSEQNVVFVYAYLTWKFKRSAKFAISIALPRSPNFRFRFNWPERSMSNIQENKILQPINELRIGNTGILVPFCIVEKALLHPHIQKKMPSTRFYEMGVQMIDLEEDLFTFWHEDTNTSVFRTVFTTIYDNFNKLRSRCSVESFSLVCVNMCTPNE